MFSALDVSNPKYGRTPGAGSCSLRPRGGRQARGAIESGVPQCDFFFSAELKISYPKTAAAAAATRQLLQQLRQLQRPPPGAQQPPRQGDGGLRPPPQQQLPPRQQQRVG